MAKRKEPASADIREPGRETGAPGSSARDAHELFDVPEGEHGVVPDLLRRVMTLGFSGLFTTESAIRGALGDTLPREWIEFFAQQSDRTREEFIARLTREFVRVLENVDVADLAEQLLTDRTIEVTAQFRLGPRSAAPGAGPAPDPEDRPAASAGSPAERTRASETREAKGSKPQAGSNPARSRRKNEQS